MPSKDKLSTRERQLARMMYLESSIQRFIKAYSRPSCRFTELEKGLAELTREKLLLAGALENKKFGG